MSIRSFWARALLPLILVPAASIGAGAEDVYLCNADDQVTISGTITNVNPPDGEFPGSFTIKDASGTCAVLFIYYLSEQPPAGCEVGKTITASGGVTNLDETGNLATPVLSAPQSISCQ